MAAETEMTIEGPAVAAGSGAAAPQPANGLAQVVKRRAACDECRTKKLKCTGEQPACSRCVREGVDCVYSPQKQMGRPKKRPRTSDEDLTTAGAIQDIANVSHAHGAGMHHHHHHPHHLDMPWLGSGANANDWDFPLDSALPALTPDSSSNSPPMLNLPPELQNTSRDPVTSMLLDPSLTSTGAHLGMPTGLLPSCACLSTLYLTLNGLQSMDLSFTFPFALHPLREAMQTAGEVLLCDQCPTRFLSAMQNTQLVGTLLVCLAERFIKILTSINAEAERAEAAHQSKKFRLADLNTSTSHLHTAGLGCAAAFSIDLSPVEWRSMAKKVVRAEVGGPTDGNDCCRYFLGICQQMEDRQHRWIDKVGVCDPPDMPRHALTGEKFGGHHTPKDQHMCLKYVEMARKMVEGMDWS